MARKTIVGAVLAATIVVSWAGTALGHVHRIDTPGGNSVTLPVEPYHGTAPGSSEHSVNYDPARGLHPLHWSLHKGPSAEERAITVCVVGVDCP